jgi:hypothetical protein
MTAAERRRRRRRKPGGRKLDITEAHIAAVEARIKELKCPSDTIEKALRHLATPFAFPLGDRNLVVACLIRKADWRPLTPRQQDGRRISGVERRENIADFLIVQSAAGARKPDTRQHQGLAAPLLGEVAA